MLIPTAAWRNLWRHKRRSLITASAMGVAAALCMAMIAIQDGMFIKMFEVLVEQQLGHVQVHHPEYAKSHQLYDTVPLAGEASVLAPIDALPGTVAVSPRLIAFALIGGAEKSAGAQLVGIDPSRDAKVTPLKKRIVAGEYLAVAPAKSVMLGKGLAEEIEVNLGDVVVAVTQAADGSMGNDLYTVTGIFKSGNEVMDRGGAYLHLHDLQELVVLPEQAHNLTLLTTDDDAIAAYADQVKLAVASDTVEVQTWQQASPQSAQMIALQQSSAYIVLGVVFIVAAFGVFNTMMMSVFERTVEIGVLRALGMRPRGVVSMIVTESVFLALISTAMGLTLGGLLDWYLVTTGIDFSSSIEGGFSFSGVTLDPIMKGVVVPGNVAMVFASLFAVSVLASLWPAFRASRLVPVDAIRSE